MKSGNYNDSLNYLLTAISYFEKSLEKDHPIVARLLTFKAELEAKLG